MNENHPGKGCIKYLQPGYCDLIFDQLGVDAKADPETCRECRKLGGPSDPRSEVPRQQKLVQLRNTIRKNFAFYPLDVRQDFARANFTRDELKEVEHLLKAPEPPADLKYFVEYCKRAPCLVNASLRRCPGLRMMIWGLDDGVKWMNANR